MEDTLDTLDTPETLDTPDLGTAGYTNARYTAGWMTVTTVCVTTNNNGHQCTRNSVSRFPLLFNMNESLLYFCIACL